MCEEEDIEMVAPAPSIIGTKTNPSKDHMMTEDMVNSYPNPTSLNPDNKVDMREDNGQGAVKRHQNGDRKERFNWKY